jgi:hypothetical protein
MTLNTAVSGAKYLMVFDLAAPPAGGEIPLLRAGVNASGGESVTIDFPAGLVMAVGIQVAESTTLGTLTLPGSAEAVFDVEFD